MNAVVSVLGFAIAVAGMAYWWIAVKKWEPRFRRYCERRYSVEIVYGSKGHWTVRGNKSWLRRFGIEWLQLVFFMVLFFGWAVGMLLGLALLSVVSP